MWIITIKTEHRDTTYSLPGDAAPSEVRLSVFDALACLTGDEELNFVVSVRRE